MGQTIYQEATGQQGAVVALARRVYHILTNNGTNARLLSDTLKTESDTQYQAPT